ncbi:MAG: hypothetical protein JXM70_22780 [Pirellulales bacterium]|nr:hypothetical protein [Pirellulales bacterium]
MKEVLLVLLMSTVVWAAPQEPQELKCDYRINPLGIDDVKPHLSWLVNDSTQDAIQATYQVQTALTKIDLKNGKNLVWDSGKVKSAQSVQVVYAGRPLQSRQRIFWRVRTWDKAGRVSPWSKSAWFETALLHKDDWRDAKWIGADQDYDGPEPAPKELMGDWIVAPAGFKVFQAENP